MTVICSGPRSGAVARFLALALVVLAALHGFQARSAAAEAPVIGSIVDATTGQVLWSQGQAAPSLSPGQRIVIKGRNFGPGPLTAAVPGVAPPAGGVPLNPEQPSVDASPDEPAGLELSKVLFGRVRALERNISSYRARIDVGTLAGSLLSRVRGRVLDYFVEEHVPTPDTWAGDIYAWSDAEVEVTVPITAYEGPIVVVRIPASGDFVMDLRNGEPLRYRDPNTARVITDDGEPAFTEGWRIARTTESPVLSSNAVPVTIALPGDARFRYAAPAQRGTTPEMEFAARQALLTGQDGPLDKSTPTGRSAQDQYSYGESTYWAWDWNLALPHFILGVDWDGVFGFNPEQGDYYLDFVRQIRHETTEIERPELEPEGYDVPVLDESGRQVSTSRRRAIVDRQTGEGVRPFPSFGAVPLAPGDGADRLIAPPIVFQDATFESPTAYPIAMAIDLPLSEPLLQGRTRPTGWVGYVRAEVANPIPGGADTAEWIGFACASCHAARVTFEYSADGKTVSKLFNGIPNPDWKAPFLALSGRTHGIATDEELPLGFIRQDQPAGTLAAVNDSRRVRVMRLLNRTGLPRGQRMLEKAMTGASADRVDKTLFAYSLGPGTTEATFFSKTNSTGDYANDYFYSPQAIPIISNHTPVRRALSHSELLDGFEGAYLHGEEPEGARGPMSSRSLQDLTLYVSTINQEDEQLRRIGLYRWLAHKDLLDLLAGEDGAAVGEGAFLSAGIDEAAILSPASFPPKEAPEGGLDAIRDLAIDPATADRAREVGLAQRFPRLAERIVRGAAEYRTACASCHSSGHLGLWTNEDMHPISAAGGAEPVGRYFSPAIWQRRTQSIRVAILQNLYWVQRRGLLSDGHLHSATPENVDGLELLVHPDRCDAPLNDDGSVDLARASDLYKKLYTIQTGAEPSFRIPGEGLRFELTTRFGPERGVIAQVPTEKTDRLVTGPEARFIRRHAYFTEGDDGYFYWDYQRMRRDYGILEFGLDPDDPRDAERIGGLPATPHPWCMEPGASASRIDDLVMFLLTL